MGIRLPFRPDALSGERFFRWRGGEVSRLEGLADAIFALALTFLVVRLEVPTHFEEVREALVRAPVYIACFALFLWIWYSHYQFHRRYGLEGPLTVAVDGAILLVVLLFVVPLRFLADGLHDRIIRGESVESRFNSSGDLAADVAVLMSFYAGGFTLVFALFALQTWLARRRRVALELDTLELAVTDGTIVAHLLSVGVGVASLTLTSIGGTASIAAGPIFALLGPLHGLHGWRVGRKLTRLAKDADI